MADSREQAAALNGAIRDRPVTAGLVNDGQVVVNEAAEPGPSPRGGETQTLRNGHGPTREVPTWYLAGWVESAYATTVYGAQGGTTAIGNLVMGRAPRPRRVCRHEPRPARDNVAHLVAETRRAGPVALRGACSRDRTDLGVAHARVRAIDDIDG